MGELWDAALRLQHSLPTWAADLWRYANGLLLLALLFIPLERTWPRSEGRQIRPAWRTDLAYYFLSSLLPARLIGPAIVMLWWLMQPWAPRGVWPTLTELPSPLRFALALLVSEVGMYWGHRAMHTVPWLWRFHAVHHSPKQLDWLVNTRAHPLDLVLTRLCGMLPLFVLGLAQPAAAQQDSTVLLVLLVASFWGYVIHANLRWRLTWLEPWLATPAFHHRHHAHLPNKATRSGNYAALLPLMDRLFGTLVPNDPAWPACYGTDEPVPSAMIDQLMGPFMGTSRPL